MLSLGTLGRPRRACPGRGQLTSLKPTVAVSADCPLPLCSLPVSSVLLSLFVFRRLQTPSIGSRRRFRGMDRVTRTSSFADSLTAGAGT